jgi:hypothetical protein
MQHSKTGIRNRFFFWLTASLLLAAVLLNCCFADDEPPYPEFIAYYDANANGFDIGTVTISLKHEGDGLYLYQQESTSSGIAALFSSDESVESSRWRLQDGKIRVLDYQSKRKDGDNDDNAHLVFDWEHAKVKNIGAGEHWEIDLPAGAVDRLVMQLAMLFELRGGATHFDYLVPRQGRIKDYRFALLGEDEIELTSGVYRTLKVGRTNDDKDQSWVWSAPELDYFPVRFLKKKKSGIKIELVLRKLDFAPFGKATSLEVAP